MPQLLYVHGSGHTQDSFAAQSSAFAGSDALSLPGHPAGRPLQSVAECAAWLARYVEWKHTGKAVVAGNSLGGAIALWWALEHPEQAQGIILIGTGARLKVSPEIFTMIDEQWPSCIDALVDRSLSSGASAALRQRVKGWHELVGRDATRADYLACDGFDVMGRLAELRLPVLVIAGADDSMTPVKYSTFLHERLAGSSLAVVPNAGHLVMAEQPEPTSAAIRAFLASLA